MFSSWSVKGGLVALFSSVLVLNAHSAVADDPAASFYSDQTVKVIVGFGAGGGGDMYSRLIARHMAAHFPGKPTIIVQNMPGAGSLKATNYLYNIAPSDGTVIGTFSEGLLLRELLGREGVKYEFTRFNWIGSAVNTTYACAARTDLDVNARDVLGGRSLVMAASALGSSPYDVPVVLNAVLGLKLKVVRGYRSTPDFVHAIEKGEADALCTTLSTLLEPAGQALVGGEAPIGRIFMVLGSKIPANQANHPLVKGVPSAEQMARTDEARKLLGMLEAPAKIHKPYAAPPGVSAERVAMLRKALMAAFEDPRFKAEIERMSLAASPISGQETEEIVRDVMQSPPQLVEHLKKILQ